MQRESVYPEEDRKKLCTHGIKGNNKLGFDKPYKEVSFSFCMCIYLLKHKNENK